MTNTFVIMTCNNVYIIHGFVCIVSKRRDTQGGGDQVPKMLHVCIYVYMQLLNICMYHGAKDI